jgi:1-aminocyclopropane-1-carboxylate deaminase
MVVDDESLNTRISEFSEKENFELVEAHDGGYGKITDANIRFINGFAEKYGIPLDPVYTGKMMKRILELIEEGFFPDGSRILAFHTGGLQGIEGANALLKKQEKVLIKRI